MDAAAAVADLDDVALVEGPLDADDADRQQRRLLAVERAQRAVVDDQRAAVARADGDVADARRAARARRRSACPTSSPASARSMTRGSAPPAISTAVPSDAASRAASSLLAMPPVPPAEPPSARASAASSTPASSGMRVAVGIDARVGGEEAADVGQQHQQIGVQADRHARRQPVVVAEAGGRGARRRRAACARRYSTSSATLTLSFSLSTGHDAQLEQAHQRRAQAQRAIAIGEILLRQQHLRRGDAELRERLGVDARSGAPARPPRRPAAARASAAAP